MHFALTQTDLLPIRRISMTENKKVLVIGGGFSGLAVRSSERTMVEPRLAWISIRSRGIPMAHWLLMKP